MSKLVSLTEALADLPIGSRVGLGGNTLHRAPCAAVHELIRLGKRDLELVKTAGAYDVDVLCGTGVAGAVTAGFIGYESVFGLAPSYRHAVEQGRVRAVEHTCYSVIAGLRAAAQGVPFMPMRGLDGSDLPELRGFAKLADPYGGGEVFVIPALPLDLAIVHVQEADQDGNARVKGSLFEDLIMIRAAKRIVLTAERIVAPDAFLAEPERTTVSSLYVDAVVETPRGAWPTSCDGCYPEDRAYLAGFLQASKTSMGLWHFLAANAAIERPLVTAQD
ncbi:MAG: CoA transferase subunit A [Chloroflexi bacterium]|nr:CoA transferase subunit A [Chloroflexota bacterium]